VSATALIADDEPNLAEDLRERVARLWPDLEILPLAANGLEALRTIDRESPDVAFLDIRMPGLTGLELAGKLDAHTHLVFITAFDQYAVEAFDRDAVDYLLKPVSDERLAKCVERLKRKLAANEKPPALEDMLQRLTRAIPGGGGRLRWIRALRGELVQQIPVDDVLYFQAADKYTCVMTREGESLIRMPLGDLAAQLDPDAFQQVHRSTIVNMALVESSRRDLAGRVHVRLRGVKEELPVSRAYAHLFKQM
jgi:DNA-binding LytR/AlgR family response regulator